MCLFVFYGVNLAKKDRGARGSTLKKKKDCGVLGQRKGGGGQVKRKGVTWKKNTKALFFEQGDEVEHGRGRKIARKSRKKKSF